MLEIKGDMNPRKRHQYNDIVSILPGSGKGQAKTEKQLRREKVKEHVTDLIDNSSLHGLSYIFDQSESLRKYSQSFLLSLQHSSYETIR